MNFNYFRGYINEIIEDKYLNIRRKFISTYQKLRYGTSDQECWNLYRVIAKHNLKKLQYFRNMQRMSYPVTYTNEYFNKQIDEVIWAYDYILDDNKNIINHDNLIYNMITYDNLDDLIEYCYKLLNIF